MNALCELVIRIDPENRRIRLENNENGIVSYKEISPEALMDSFRQSIRTEGMMSGFLPPNCFHITVNPDKSKVYCLWYPELHADISYYGTEYENFPLPRLVFSFRVSDQGKVSACKLGVIDDERPTAETNMYHYPFSNVGGFNLCVGNNALPIYKKPHALANLPGFLLRLPNNNDSYRQGNNKLSLPYRELLNHLKDKEPSYYYSDILVPNDKCLGDFVSGRY